MPLRKASDGSAVVVDTTLPVQHKNVQTHEASRAVGYTHPDAKGRQISRQGLFQAALQSPALMQFTPDIDSYLVLVRKVAEAGLAFVNE